MRMRLSIACVAGAVLVSEVTLTRLFSVTMIYHFAFLVLSMAMFGLAAGGIFNFLCEIFRKRATQALPALPLASALLLPLAIGASLHLPFSPSNFDASNVAALVLIILLCTVPFFTCGLFFSLVYLVLKKSVSQLYAYDLIGAGAACLIAIFLIERVGATGTPWVASALLLAGSALAVDRLRLSWVYTAAPVVVLIVAGSTAGILDVRYVKGHEENPIEFEKWNAFSRVAISNSGSGKVIHIDADAATELPSAKWAAANGKTLLDQITGFVYALRTNSHALIIGPGGGREVVAALEAHNRVTGVEINPIIVRDIMLNRYLEYSGRRYSQPGVEIITGDARSFLERSTGTFEVIQANAIDSWAAASSGGFTLNESYIYTVEAFEQYFQHLEESGILTFGRWVFEIPQQTLRVVSLALEAMDRLGIPNPASRFFIVSDESYKQGGGIPGVVFIKKIPFDRVELELLRRKAAHGACRILYDPEVETGNAFEQLIRTSDRDSFFRKYPLNIQPVTDDQPFFFFTLKWNDIFDVWKTPEESRKNNAGLFVLLLVSIIMAVLTGLCLILPVVWRDSPSTDGATALFFLLIGLAFMMVEIAVIQKSALFLGHPTYAFVIVLFSLLLGAGTGSWNSGRNPDHQVRKALVRSAVVAALFITVLALGLPFWLKIGFGWMLPLRIGWLGILLMAAGFFMGRLFPLSLRRLQPGQVPWAWALNGTASVLGSCLAVLLAMTAGFTVTLWSAALLYGCAAVAGTPAWKGSGA